MTTSERRQMPGLHTAPCRHYVTVDISVLLAEQAPSQRTTVRRIGGVTVTSSGAIESLEDPEQLLVDLAECVPDAKYVTLVFDVTDTRGLRLVAVHPHVSAAHGREIVGQLKAQDIRLWFTEEHAALTNHGWLDVEALDGD